MRPKIKRLAIVLSLCYFLGAIINISLVGKAAGEVVTVRSIKIVNVSEKGFDVQIDASCSVPMTFDIYVWRAWFYQPDDFRYTNFNVASGVTTIHVPMAAIGVGSDYVLVGVHINGSSFGDLPFKLDTVNPTISVTQPNTAPSLDNTSIIVSGTDNFNIIKRMKVTGPGTNITREVYSKPKILFINWSEECSNVFYSFYNAGYDVTFNDKITSVSQMAGYDIIAATFGYYTIPDATANLLNQAYAAGYNILSAGNDTRNNIKPITTTVTSSGDYGFVRHISPSSVPDHNLGAPDHLMEYFPNADIPESDGGYEIISGLAPGARAIARINPTDYDPTLLEMIDSTTGAKWIHYQFFRETPILDRRAADELMWGTTRKRQTYSETFNVTSNGTYTVTAEDQSGNITTKTITVDNIRRPAPKTNSSTLAPVQSLQLSAEYPTAIADLNMLQNGDFAEGLKNWEIGVPPTDTSVTLNVIDTPYGKGVQLSRTASDNGYWPLRYLGSTSYIAGHTYTWQFKYKVVQGIGVPFQVGWWLDDTGTGTHLVNVPVVSTPLANGWYLGTASHTFVRTQNNFTDALGVNSVLSHSILQFADITLVDSTMQYKIGSSGTWQRYINPITITNNGDYYFRYTDNKGMLSMEARHNVANIDKTGPGAPTINPNRTGFGTTNVSFTITNGVDTGIGSDYSEYQINGGAWTRYSTAVTVSTDGNYTINARSIDKFGNVGAIGSTSFSITHFKVTWDATNTIAFGNVNPTISPKVLSKPIKFNVISEFPFKIVLRATNNLVGTKGSTTPNKVGVKINGTTTYYDLINGVDTIIGTNLPATTGTDYYLDFQFKNDWLITPDNYNMPFTITVTQ